MWHPRRAKARTVARPTPADAPVTTTTRFTPSPSAGVPEVPEVLEVPKVPVPQALWLDFAVVHAQPGQRERAERQAEIAQSDVEVRRDHQQVDDDPAQPGADDEAA